MRPFCRRILLIALVLLSADLVVAESNGDGAPRPVICKLLNRQLDAQGNMTFKVEFKNESNTTVFVLQRPYLTTSYRMIPLPKKSESGEETTLEGGFLRSEVCNCNAAQVRTALEPGKSIVVELVAEAEAGYVLDEAWLEPAYGLDRDDFLWKNDHRLKPMGKFVLWTKK